MKLKAVAVAKTVFAVLIAVSPFEVVDGNRRSVDLVPREKQEPVTQLRDPDA
jgi:hypothetical protein